MPTIKKAEKIQAVRDNVLVEMIEEKKESDAGIALPSESNERETCVLGKVVSIPIILTVLYEAEKGSQELRRLLANIPNNIKELFYTQIKEGDVLILKKYDYVKVKVGDGSKDYRLYNVNSIIAKTDGQYGLR